MPSRAGPGVDGHDGALAAELVRDVAHQIGTFDGGGVHRDLVRAGPEEAACILRRPDPAPDRERDEDLVGGARHHVDHGVALVRRRGDVEERDLVGALGVVAGGQLDRVALVGQVDEAHALDDAPAGDVEAGDQSDAAHAAIPSSTLKPAFHDRLAHDGAGQAPASRPAARPALRGPPRSRRHPTPPPASDVAASSACSPARSGPDNMPSRATDVATTAPIGSCCHSSSRSVSGLARSGQPPLRLRLGHPVLADAVVQPDGHPPRPATGTAARQRGLLERGRAEHDPRHAGLEDLARRRPRSGCRRRTPRRTPASSARRTIPPSTARSCGTPVRAPSRSTTWIQRAPAADVARRQRDRVAVAVLAPEVTLRQAHRGAGAQVDGRQQLHQAAALASAHEVPQQGQPGRARLLRVELRAPQRAACGQCRHVAAVVAHRRRLVPDRRRERVHEVDPGSRAEALQRLRPGRVRRPAPHTSSVFHCICGCFTPAGSGATTPRKMPRPAAPGLSTEPS